MLNKSRYAYPLFLLPIGAFVVAVYQTNLLGELRHHSQKELITEEMDSSDDGRNPLHFSKSG